MRAFLRVAAVIVLSIGLFASTGCASRDSKLALESISVPEDAATIDFAQQFDFDWDRVFVFAPYSTREQVESRLGFEWSQYNTSGIEALDSVCLVVFASGDSVVGWYDQPRSVDLVELDRSDGYPRSEAVFSVGSEEGRLSLHE